MRVGARVRAKALEPGHGEAKAEASVGVGSAQNSLTSGKILCVTDFFATRTPRARAISLAHDECTIPSRGSGSACESDGDDSDGQGAPQGGGGVQSPRLGPRSGNFAGFKGLEASFMRK